MLIPLHDNNPTRRWPVVTLLLIAVNLGIGFVTLRASEARQRRTVAEWGFVPQRIAQLGDRKLVVEIDVTPTEDAEAVDDGRKERTILELKPVKREVLVSLFSCMFLHGGWMHLIGNMWFLWIFGNNIEDRLGHFIFLIFYLLTGLLASACHWATDSASIIPVLGASGAVAGVLGAYAVTFPKARVKTLIFFGLVIFIELPALVLLGFWLLMQLFWGIGFLLLAPGAAGIAFWAHVGGFVAGCLVMPLMAAGAPDPGTHWEDEVETQFQ